MTAQLACLLVPQAQNMGPSCQFPYLVGWLRVKGSGLGFRVCLAAFRAQWAKASKSVM